MRRRAFLVAAATGLFAGLTAFESLAGKGPGGSGGPAGGLGSLGWALAEAPGAAALQGNGALPGKGDQPPAPVLRDKAHAWARASRVTPRPASGIASGSPKSWVSASGQQIRRNSRPWPSTAAL